MAQANELEFGEWYGVFDEGGNKKLVGSSGSGDITLTVYVDEQLITRLKFNPKRSVRLATFDGKRYRGMNFQSLYGYDHWIRRMKKHYNLRVWFEQDEKCEVFSLNGFSKGIRWLQ
jgi:hypothetical protein